MSDIEDLLNMAFEVSDFVDKMPIRTNLERELLFYLLWRTNLYANDSNARTQANVEQLGLFKNFFKRKQ